MPPSEIELHRACDLRRICSLTKSRILNAFFHTLANGTPRQSFSDLVGMRTCVLILLQIGGAIAHGSLNIPVPRNNHGQLPLNTTRGASHGPSCLGDVCGWFAAGCFINCAQCTNASNGADVPSYPPGSCVAARSTLPEAYRTYNRAMKSALGDWTASHPQVRGSPWLHQWFHLVPLVEPGGTISGFQGLL